MIGMHPHPRDLPALLAAGITTFVSLIGEYTTQVYRTDMYPAHVTDLPSHPSVHFIHFPIRDFGVPLAFSLKLAVEEIERRLMLGEVVFVHCRGGHGFDFCFCCCCCCSFFICLLACLF